MKKKEGRYVYDITIHTEHYLANLLALRKILGFTLTESKEVVKMGTGKSLLLTKPIKINSDLSTDEIHQELDEYQIQVKITNI